MYLWGSYNFYNLKQSVRPVAFNYREKKEKRLQCQLRYSDVDLYNEPKQFACKAYVDVNVIVIEIVPFCLIKAIGPNIWRRVFLFYVHVLILPLACVWLQWIV